MKERREKERTRERSTWREKERVHKERECAQEDAGLRVRRGDRRRGSRVARCHKRRVRDLRLKQDARRTQTRVLSPRRVDTRGTQTRA